MGEQSHRGKPITGRKALFLICSAFGVILAANLTLSYLAVATFPGLEVKNSYVASQTFDADKQAQVALEWDVGAVVEDNILRLNVSRKGVPVEPKIIAAVLGRATNVAQDQTPTLEFDGRDFVAQVDLAKGNWNLRLVAEANDGTLFRQRIIVRVVK